MSLKRLSFILPFLFLLAAITGVSASEAAESPRAPVKPSGANYAQTLYSYETGVDCLLWSNSIDWRGEYYHLKQNALRTKSYIYQNYGPSNRTNPLITLNSSVEDFEVTADPKGSYLYYQLAGDNMTVYRQPLAKSVDLKPERKEFSFGGTPFAFETFALA